MYQPVRLRKLRPDGTVRASWWGYLLDERGGFTRLFVPPLTPRLHTAGTWAPDGVSVAAFDPARPYVVHWWSGIHEGEGFYVDAARTIEIGSDTISYVDLFVDMSFHDGSWHTLDEDELVLASADDALAATGALGEARRLIAATDPLFDLRSELWTYPPEARALPPRVVEALV